MLHYNTHECVPAQQTVIACRIGMGMTATAAETTDSGTLCKPKPGIGKVARLHHHATAYNPSQARLRHC